MKIKIFEFDIDMYSYDVDNKINEYIKDKKVVSINENFYTKRFLFHKCTVRSIIVITEE